MPLSASQGSILIRLFTQQAFAEQASGSSTELDPGRTMCDFSFYKTVSLLLLFAYKVVSYEDNVGSKYHLPFP